MDDLKKKYRSPMQWQFWIIRERINPTTGKIYTEEEAKIHVSSFRKWSKYYWLKRGYSEEESINKVSELQTTLCNKSVKKHKGRTDRVPVQKDYWIKKGYSVEDAVELVKERQNTFSIEKCIEKYGETGGRKRHLERQIKWQDTLKNKEDQTFQMLKGRSLETFFSKNLSFDDYCDFRKHIQGSDGYLIDKTKKFLLDNKITLTTENFNKYFYFFQQSLCKKRGVASYESLKYFIPLYKFCRRNGIERDDIMIGVSGSKEFVIKRNIKRIGKRGVDRQFRFDFTILSKKLIFEYNHIDFHPDPDIMGDEFDNFLVPLSNMPAKEKYEYDKLKMRTAREHGYNLHIIWSHEDFEKQMKIAKDLILK